MKILVFSDIHGDFVQLQKMLKIYEQNQYDLMIVPGDFINHGPRNGLPSGYDPQKCSELLNQYRNKIVAARGNCDAEVCQMLIQFPILNEYTQLYADNYRIFIHHGHIEKYLGENLKKILPPSDHTYKTLVISGHTHIPVLKDEEGYTYLNPGSITFPKGGSKQSYATIDTQLQKIEMHTLD